MQPARAAVVQLGFGLACGWLVRVSLQPSPSLVASPGYPPRSPPGQLSKANPRPTTEGLDLTRSTVGQFPKSTTSQLRCGINPRSTWLVVCCAWWTRHEIWDDGHTSKGVIVRHTAVARTPAASSSDLPSQHSAPTSGPTRPPRPRCHIRSALRLRPSAEAEAPHGRATTTLRRGFVPVGAIAVGGCGSRMEPSIRARAGGKEKNWSRAPLKSGVREIGLRRVVERRMTNHWHSFEQLSLTAPASTIPSRPRLIIRSTSGRARTRSAGLQRVADLLHEARGRAAPQHATIRRRSRT